MQLKSFWIKESPKCIYVTVCATGIKQKYRYNMSYTIEKE